MWYYLGKVIGCGDPVAQSLYEGGFTYEGQCNRRTVRRATAVINSSLAGVYRTAVDRGAKKVYGMLYGIQGLLDEQYVDLSKYIRSDLDVEILKRTPSAFLGTCRYKLPDIHGESGNLCEDF